VSATSSAPAVQRFASFDGVEIAWREIGDGQPLVLLHGLFSNAEMNWIRWGTAALLAEAGFRVIMPDFRGHGLSEAPHDAAAYPPDVLARDTVELVRHLGLEDFDLGGYSLGARTAIRLVVTGMRSWRLVLAGMGLEGVLNSDDRTAYFLRVIETRDSARPGTREWMAAQFLKTTRTDAEAVAHVLRSQVQTTREELAALAIPTLVVSGSEDRDNGSAVDLAAALPDARYVEIPGNHMSAVTGKELGATIRSFLTDDVVSS
jgi:pimeloyl-ACP methyl ester carboxylesterase